MKIVAVFLLLISFPSIAQEQSTYLLFVQDNDTFPDCSTQFAVNGWYSLGNSLVPEVEIPGATLVDPLAIIKDSVLYSFANPITMAAFGSFEVPDNYYVPRTWRESDSILQLLDSNSRYYWHDPIYLSEHNFVPEPQEFTVQQRQEERQKQLNEERKKMLEEQEKKGQIVHASPTIIDGVYIEETLYIQKIPYYTAHPEIKDSVDLAHNSVRKELETLVDSLLQPFYFSTHEVTNKEYREFVAYVRDSIAIHIVYKEVEDKLAATLLNVSKKGLKSLDLNERDANLKKYGWKTPLDNFYDNPEFAPYLTELYYPQPQRYYTRKQFDVHKFNYCQNESTTLNIYPDTLGFNKIEPYSVHHMTDMYFWHPFFDNFPVVNVSYDQMMAFCHWKERQINKKMTLDSLWINVSLPSIRQYEFALKQSLPDALKHQAHDYSNSHYATFERSNTSYNYFLRSVSGTKKYPKTEKKAPWTPFDYDFAAWMETNSATNKQFPFLNGNVSEMVKDEVISEEMAYYGLISEKNPEEMHYVLGANYFTDVKVLGDDQFNAVFYKTLQEKTTGNCTTGFRLVYSVRKR